MRQGDIFNLPLESGQFDLVTVHQVLHFLDRPERAIAEAARMLAAGGRLIIIDLAPHALEYLRDDHAHARLGFAHQTMSDWLSQAGLTLEKAVDLSPDHSRERQLTVTIWLARARERAVPAVSSALASIGQ